MMTSENVADLSTNIIHTDLNNEKTFSNIKQFDQTETEII